MDDQKGNGMLDFDRDVVIVLGPPNTLLVLQSGLGLRRKSIRGIS